MAKKKYAVGFALAASLAFLQPLQAHAEPYTVAFDNGGIGYDWRRCISGPNHCGISDGERFTLYNPFTLGAETHVVGFRNWNSNGAADAYVKTYWSLWRGMPGSGGTVLYAGSDVADISSDHGFNMATLVGLDITLGSGTYWLGLSHEATDIWTYVVPATWVTGALQGDGRYYSSVGQMAFQVLAVPEPSTSAFALVGLALVALIARARSVQPNVG